jgi:hypothetical protein
MQRNYSVTLCTRPFLFFFQQELFRTDGLDSKPVFDQTDMISQPVSFIDLFDWRAGKG